LCPLHGVGRATWASFEATAHGGTRERPGAPHDRRPRSSWNFGTQACGMIEMGPGR
jgi:hypothetical protein